MCCVCVEFTICSLHFQYVSKLKINFSSYIIKILESERKWVRVEGCFVGWLVGFYICSENAHKGCPKINVPLPLKPNVNFNLECVVSNTTMQVFSINFHSIYFLNNKNIKISG